MLFRSPVVGDVAHALEDIIRVWKAKSHELDKKALQSWWKEIDGWRAKDCLKYRANKDVIMPQYAIQRLYELSRDKDVYITTEVASTRCGRRSSSSSRSRTAG